MRHCDIFPVGDSFSIGSFVNMTVDLIYDIKMIFLEISSFCWDCH